ncbi:Ribosomal protein L25 [Candidatus Magnetoovum chiemensis]|nr:Ribosomal protein L25 [Candidatus Magnetoovum chiemensis]
MERITLNAMVRNVKGKGSSRKLRRQQIIPCVVYKGGQSTPIQIPKKEFLQFMNSQADEQKLINLKFDDGTVKVAILKAYQLEPVRGRLLHGDFYEISMDKLVKVTISIHLTGESIGVKRDGGILQSGLREIEIECLPDNIPSHIDIDVSELTVGHSLHIRDLKIPEGIKVLTDPEELVATIASTAKAVSEAEGAAEERKEPELIKKGKAEEGKEK